MIWQILSFPAYLDPLREELSEVLEREGGWTERALAGMVRLDSFIRETLRMYPPSVFACMRTVLGRPYDFGDNVILSPGSRIMFPTKPVHLDPDNYDSAESFQGFRFVKSTANDHVSHTSSTTIDEKYLSFGYSKQACPGRFLAVRNAKLIFGRLIMNYDLKWAHAPRERPKSMVIEGVFIANLDIDISIQLRDGQKKEKS